MRYDLPHSRHSLAKGIPLRLKALFSGRSSIFLPSDRDRSLMAIAIAARIFQTRDSKTVVNSPPLQEVMHREVSVPFFSVPFFSVSMDHGGSYCHHRPYIYARFRSPGDGRASRRAASAR
ncbi:MAG: hypothetical protein AAF704_04265 [Cyanobacteria bacterium P01_D01_bin.123]